MMTTPRRNRNDDLGLSLSLIISLILIGRVYEFDWASAADRFIAGAIAFAALAVVLMRFRSLLRRRKGARIRRDATARHARQSHPNAEPRGSR
jgi:uncharacterized membrane protein YccC